MKLTSTIISIVALFSFAIADNLPDNTGKVVKVTAYHNTKYDNSKSSISTVKCYNDQSAKYPTLGKLPTYPNIGGYLNADCGSCWAVAYDTVTTIYVLIVDGSDKGLQLSQKTMNALGKKSGIHGGPYSSFDVKVTVVDKSKCGL